ncbi:MAG: MFS transporter [Xanthomonadales bacterium]|nr:MFS transporter [Xanthomonadales bacterium]MBK7145460.1 MFS transporter [Xanthomonadales bacterium]MCC6563230.1 MFS transporter [Xanthomonadales bacterium]
MSGALREVQAAAIAALYFFLVLGSYYLIRPVREQLGAAAGGSDALPWLWTGTFLATLVLTPFYGAIVARHPRRVFIPVTYAFFAIGMVAFSPLLRTDAPGTLLAAGFYIWVSVFNLFVVAVFWSFMADLFTDEQARRLFGPIGIGGTIGAIAGPTAAKELVGQVGVAGLMWMSALALCAALLCVLALTHWAKQHGRRDARIAEQPIGGGLWSGAVQVLRDPFLRAMAILMLLSDVIGTMLYALNSDIARDTLTTAIARTEYFAGIDQAANGLQMIFQLLLAPLLMSRLGPLAVLLFAAAMNIVVLAAVGCLPGAETTMLAMVISRAGGYGLVQPARDSLYTRVPRELRYKSKAFIDTAVWRAGDVLTSFAMLGLRGIGFGVATFAAMAGVASLATMWFSWRAVRSSEQRRDPE